MTKQRNFDDVPFSKQTHQIRQFLEDQGYLDKLAAARKTAPKAAMTESSTFRIKCGDDDFTGIHMMSSTIRVRESYTR